MTRLIAALFIALIAAPHTQAAEFSAAEKTEMNAIIREYILQNPEVLVEAMQVLEQRQNEQVKTSDQQKIATLKDAIFNDGFSHAIGNPDGDVTLIEFTDYRCPYCKRAHESVSALLEADPNVRVVIKEFPILGPESTYASRAAMAALRQGGELYERYSDAMLEHKGDLDQRAVMMLAERAGADMARLKTDMDLPEIAEQIRQTYALARELEINGTPGFIIGDEIVRGFVPYEALREKVEIARRDG
ncbi:MAG: DsbA family protein [Paracoccaceae bacterium]